LRKLIFDFDKYYAFRQNRIQKGGKNPLVDIDSIHYKVDVRNKQFTVHESDEGDIYTFNVYKENDDNTKCILIFITKGKNKLNNF
jgi:hypothetical protein